ncbi:hypothetical protein BDN70DRAFT_931823 [Pholiota conissans]|uniref:Uncharacterized protein n=1 Tax=Pholiota conissans TaxID=109636 RepID=A0A9P5Z476_9AGAR|nr:hypothetical protein BDN70DRAFT_931823 [Pholiota conissans]
MALATSDYQSRSATSSTIVSTNEPPQPRPMTATEQYWATRALRAEALLEAQHEHKKEVQTMGEAHDIKRERELAALAKEYKEKHAYLEKLLIFLLSLIALLVLLVIYLATHYTRHSLLMQSKLQVRWWSAIGASHFTIPILSPFTSVIEQETSVIGTRLIATVSAILACVSYFAFRHWLVNQAQVPATSSANSSITNATMTTISRAIS